MNSVLFFIIPLGILLTVVSFLILYDVKEGFQEESDEQKLRTVYRKFTGILCPALDDVKRELQQDPSFDSKTLPTFQCPPIEDLTTLPPTIGKDIVSTIYYLVRTLKDVNQKLTDSLQASCTKTTESFINMPQDMNQISPELRERMRNELFKQRLNTILQATSPPEVLEALANVEVLHKKMKEIQQNPDALKSAC